VDQRRIVIDAAVAGSSARRSGRRGMRQANRRVVELPTIEQQLAKGELGVGASAAEQQCIAQRRQGAPRDRRRAATPKYAEKPLVNGCIRGS